MDNKAEIDKSWGNAKSQDKKTSTNQSKITRRNFLIGVGGLALLGGLNRASQAVKDRLDGSTEKSSSRVGQEADFRLERVREDKETLKSPKSMFDEVLGELPQKDKGVARSIVDEMKHEVLYPHSSFEELLEVTRKNETFIRQAARDFDFPEELALGIVFIENGGGQDETSFAGARGPAQLMPETAKRYGLVVNDEIDQRTDPDKCFRAMCNYLQDMRKMFGNDLGIAIWGYHAGEGNVFDALWVYFKDVEGADLGNFLAATSSEEAQAIAKAYSEKITQGKVNVHKILANEAVKSKVLNFLGDETELYVYKAVAGAEIIKEQSLQSILVTR